MEFRTAEEKLLHDYGELEDENARLEDENNLMRNRITELEKRLEDMFEQNRRLLVERDQRTDCIKDMMAVAKFYGIDQPQHIPSGDPLPEDMRKEYGLKAVEQA